MINYIKSRSNSKVKETAALKNKKYRNARMEFLTEGVRAVSDVAESGAVIKSLFVSEKTHDFERYIEMYRDCIPEINVLSESAFSLISDTVESQGIAAVTGIPDFSSEYRKVLGDDEADFIVIAEGIRDPGNMGTIIRTADAAGVDFLISVDNCVDIYSPKVVRSTAGSLFHLPVMIARSAADVFLDTKRAGYRTFAACINDAVSMYEVNLEGKVCIVIGNEGRGVSAETAALSDCRIKIPMPGKAESLNASVAAGILMYEKFRSGIR